MYKKIVLLIISILSIFFVVSQCETSYAAEDPISTWSLNSIFLPHTLANHVIAGNSNKLFIIGGATADDYSDVYSSSTSIDGTVSSWSLKNNLPATRYGMAKAEKDNTAYVLGGISFDGSVHFVNNVYFSSTQGDGNLSNWQETTPLPQSAVEGEAVVVGNRIYFAGGVNSVITHNEVYMAQINPDGTLGSWSHVSTMPNRMVTFGMVAYQNRIYIIGGNRGFITDEVYWADVDPATGSLTSWQAEDDLIQPFADKNQTVLVGNKIIIVGGADGVGTSNKVFYTTINPDKSLAPWQQSASSLPLPVAAGALTYANGYLYLTGGVSVGYSNKVYYSKVLGSSLSVPLLKQSDPAWSGFTYDSANKWNPLDPTIERWGCALTSAAMVFQYHGIKKLPDGVINLDPGTLNTWLKSQGDGYVGSGLVNWLALTRLSKIAKAVNPDFISGNALEFSRVPGANIPKLISDLANNIPDILEEPGHFIVATGTGSATFTINDPFYSRTDLTSYGNTFLSLSRFVPSFTDLSYIMAVADSEVEFDLMTASGSAVGESFTQQPLDFDGGAGNSGNPSKIIMLPKPSSGNYNLEVSSLAGKSFSLGIYLYDENGNVKMATSSGVVGPGDKDKYIINFDKDNSGDSSQNQIITFQTFLDDLNSLCRLGDINKISCVSLLIQARTAYELSKIQVTSPAARALLRAIDKEISLQKARGVSNNAYNIIHTDIQFLLSSI